MTRSPARIQFELAFTADWDSRRGPAEVRARVAPHGAAEWWPDSAVVVAGALDRHSDACNGCCPVLNFFATPANGERWLAEHPEERGNSLANQFLPCGAQLLRRWDGSLSLGDPQDPLGELARRGRPVYLSGDSRHNGVSMIRLDAAGTPGSETLLEGEGELRKPRDLLAGAAASAAEPALRRAAMFEPDGARLFAYPIARATISDEHPVAKRSEEPRAARPLLDDLRVEGFAASTAIQCARIDLLTGGLSTAEEELRRAWDASASIGENYLLPPIAALLAEVLSAQGRLDEAAEFRRAAEALASSDDTELQALWPSLRGEVLAWQERAHAAKRRAREAIDLIRIRAALSRLTAAYSQNTSTDGDRLASDRRAWNAGGRAARPITERLDEHAEHIVEVFLNAIEAERLYIDNEGGVHIAPAHGIRLHAAIAAIERAYGRPPQPPARRAHR